MSIFAVVISAPRGDAGECLPLVNDQASLRGRLPERLVRLDAEVGT